MDYRELLIKYIRFQCDTTATVKSTFTIEEKEAIDNLWSEIFPKWKLVGEIAGQRKAIKNEDHELPH